MPEKELYICQKCDAQFPKWNGRCSECGAWGSLQQLTVNNSQLTAKNAKPAELVDLNKLDLSSGTIRLKTGIEEIDRVFGGGLTAGSLTLIGGEPGIGKSTIVAQIANAVAHDNLVIYASGEESTPQVAARFKRLNCQLDNLRFTSETDTDKIISASLTAGPKLLIIDSIQTVLTNEAPSEAGSLTQIRASAAKFLGLAKQNNIAVILIGHITKDGQLAGPKSLEHIVDTVIYLETDSSQNYRLLRATKNRFGSTNEVGIFLMTGTGFEPINNPAGIFLEAGLRADPGSAVSAVMEGSRPFLLEIQALVTKTVFGYPQRKAAGFDLNRLQILTAVLNKRSKINLGAQDVILNLVGGLKSSDPGLDLAVVLAIASSFYNKPLPKATLILGEIGLSGEIRPVSRLDDKLAAATKLGFQQALVPEQKRQSKNLDLTVVKNIEEAMNHLTNNK